MDRNEVEGEGTVKGNVRGLGGRMDRRGVGPIWDETFFGISLFALCLFLIHYHINIFMMT